MIKMNIGGEKDKGDERKKERKPVFELSTIYGHTEKVTLYEQKE